MTPQEVLDALPTSRSVASLGAIGDAALASGIAVGLILGGGAALAAQRRLTVPFIRDVLARRD